MSTRIKRSPSSSLRNPTRTENNLPVPRLEKYKTLLHSIAIKLGLEERESFALVEQICLAGKRSYGQPDDCTLKVWLSKILVHHCIFKISTVFFSQKDPATPSIGYKIPISFRTVYVLTHSQSFTEKEVAHILNITTVELRQRLARAELLLQGTRH